ncbi:alpha/beta fold hydrolase [Modicisalibacter coralii]|uniref:alpha/beta fold hydrolase n=1 Tax=Modicisalibacter coralii TaxID=2304602 RepID=UPI00100BD894|nr:alpha/beta fold hydrolase [Halomonas coralii]
MTRLVLLAGWGIDARIWHPLAPHWPSSVHVSAPDWPGYRHRPALDDPQDHAALAETMRDDLPRDAVWVGWSLGGLLAGALLDHLPPPRRLILLGTTGRFTDARPGGVSRDQLDQFRGAFERRPETTWRHFLRWQTRGEPRPGQQWQSLSALLGGQAPADTATLAAGLDQLAGLDLSPLLASAPCPIHRLTGEHDPLLPREVDIERLANAGHCPQLGAPDALAARLASLADRVQPSELT